MYGKSYDALTGLIGVDHRPPGLGAVVSQEPVYDDYRYLYGDGMRRENSVATPAQVHQGAGRAARGVVPGACGAPAWSPADVDS